MILLKNIAYTSDNQSYNSELAKTMLQTGDPLFSLCVKLFKENKIMRELLDDREKPNAGLVKEELDKVRNIVVI